MAGTAPAMAAYINGHDIAGVRATDAQTLVFHLTRPAGDFVNILAMPFASAAPHEYLRYVPDSAAFRQHTISDGPYQIVKYTANQSITLDKNPAWAQAADPIRHQYVDHVTVTEGQDAGPVQQQIQAGTADLEVLGEDYVRTARAKGITEQRVMYRHALRSALTPVVTQLGIDVGALLGGAVITGNVFGLPGLGRLAVQSVVTQDLPVVVGIVLLAAFFVVTANIVVDLTYALLDPRVHRH